MDRYLNTAGSQMKHDDITDNCYSTEHKFIEKITATQPRRIVLKVLQYLRTVCIVLEPGETPSNSASHQAPNYVQRS